MQQTRINTIFSSSIERLGSFFTNPWRRIALSLICLLLGFFIGNAVSTTLGQAAQWDVVVAAIILIFTELVSRFVYQIASKQNKISLWIDILNIFKIGLTYSFYLEAFKLGS